MSRFTNSSFLSGKDGSSFYVPSTPPVPPVALPFISNWQILSNGDSIQLPLRADGIYSFNVSWGDGNSDTINAWDAAAKVHTYATAGQYTVTIEGQVDYFDFYQDPTSKDNIIAVTQWGDIGILQTSYCFYQCSSLGNVASDYWQDATDVSYLFNGTNIDINADLFRGCSGITDASHTFANNSYLNVIPAELFNDCINIVYFNGTFENCPSLQGVPSLLFSTCVLAEEFVACFDSCVGLTQVGSGLLDNCVPVDISYMFNNVTAPRILDIGNWNIANLTTALSFVVASDTMAINDYNDLLIGWSAQAPSIQSGVQLDYSAQYNSDAQSPRFDLINNYSWMISDNGPSTAAFSTEWVTSISDEIIYLPIPSSGTYAFMIDFGDGTEPQWITDYNNNSHTYAVAGTYTINIWGTMTEWSFYLVPNSKDNITAVYNWGELGITFAQGSFNACTNLATVVDGMWQYCTTIESCFSGCTSLTSVPSTLLDIMTGLTNASYAFMGSGLAEIPAGLFANNPLLEYVDHTFELTPITSIPNQMFLYNTALFSANGTFAQTDIISTGTALFHSCTLLNNVSGCFFNCTSLTSVENDQFYYNGALTSVAACFQGCTNLISTPSGLFDYNSAISDYSNCFQGCTQLTDVIDAGNWSIAGATYMSDMFDGVTLSSDSYSLLLSGWAQQAYQSGVTFSGGSSKYWSVANDARYTLEIAGGWAIIDAGVEATIPMSMKFTTTTSPETVTLPVDTGNPLEILVFWGDAVGVYKYTDPTLAYHEFATAGTYSVNIIAHDLPTFDFANFGISASNLTEIDSWGDCAANIANLSFKDCVNLTTINDANLYSYLTTAAELFSGTTSLTSLPSGLFDGLTNVDSFSYCFYNSGLTSLPSGLFDLCASAIYFSNCFDGVQITAVPANFFDAIQPQDLSYCFNNCASLTDCDCGTWDWTAVTGAAGLFDASTINTTDYDSSLLGIAGQTGLPANITVSFGSSLYTSGGAVETARDLLVDSGGLAWILTDGGPV